MAKQGEIKKDKKVKREPKHLTKNDTFPQLVDQLDKVLRVVCIYKRHIKEGKKKLEEKIMQ